MKNNTDLLNDSIQGLHNCKNTLKEIAKTCCMPERSPNMERIKLSLHDLIMTTSQIEQNTNNTHECIDSIGTLGSQIGFLYATCCTSTREPLYQSIFKELMLIHVTCGKLKVLLHIDAN